MKDFSIFDEENGIEVFVFLEFNNNTQMYETVFSGAVDIFYGYPMTLSSIMKEHYDKQIVEKLKEINYGH